MLRTSASLVCGRAAKTKSTGITTSRVMTSGSPSTISSRVMPTAPPTEFSHGTRAASASPSRTASSASGTLRTGVRIPLTAAGMVISACSVNVLSGPR
jgi:hypothetical protein